MTDYLFRNWRVFQKLTACPHNPSPLISYNSLFYQRLIFSQLPLLIGCSKNPTKSTCHMGLSVEVSKIFFFFFFLLQDLGRLSVGVFRIQGSSLEYWYGKWVISEAKMLYFPRSLTRTNKIFGNHMHPHVDCRL